MPRYYTEADFRQIRDSLNESEFRTFSAESHPENSQFDVFLSYNFDDRTMVKAVYKWLRGLGLKVYLDFIVDPSLQRNNVTMETARRIHNRLMHSKSLLYAQSPNAANSRWMPWELGVVDGNTKMRCAVLPIMPYSSYNYGNQEYLMLYPVVKLITDSYNRTNPFIYKPDSIYGTSLTNFLKGI